MRRNKKKEAKEGYETSVMREALLACKLNLDEALDNLELAMLQDQSRPGWVMGYAGSQGRIAAMRIYREIEYQPRQIPQETVKLVGVLSASTKTIACAKAVNNAKEKLICAIEDLRKEFLKFHEAPSASTRSLALTRALTMLGLKHFHFRQAKRSIQIVESCPIRQGFSYLKTRDVYRITKQDAIARQKVNGGLRSHEIEELGRVHELEYLAVANPTKAEARLNVVLRRKQTDDNTVKENNKKTVQVSMPVLVLMDETENFPPFEPLPKVEEWKPSGRKRSDRKLMEPAILPAIRVYRYKKEYRELQNTKLRIVK